MGVERKRLAAIAAILGGLTVALLATQSGKRQAPDPVNPVDAALLGTVLVDLPGRSGSGSVLGRLKDGRLVALTCRHVVAPPMLGIPFLPETLPEMGDVEILGLHPTLDAALVVLPRSPADGFVLPLQVRGQGPDPGEDAVVSGFPFRRWKVVARGLILGETVSAVVVPGMSGGPVLGRDGKLVGIVSARLVHQDTQFAVGLFVPIRDLLPWLRDSLATQGIEVE